MGGGERPWIRGRRGPERGGDLVTMAFLSLGHGTRGGILPVVSDGAELGNHAVHTATLQLTTRGQATKKSILQDTSLNDRHGKEGWTELQHFCPANSCAPGPWWGSGQQVWAGHREPTSALSSWALPRAVRGLYFKNHSSRLFLQGRAEWFTSLLGACWGPSGTSGVRTSAGTKLPASFGIVAVPPVWS